MSTAEKPNPIFMPSSVLTAGLSVTRVVDSLGQVEQRLYLYTWHVRELAPRRA